MLPSIANIKARKPKHSQDVVRTWECLNITNVHISALRFRAISSKCDVLLRSIYSHGHCFDAAYTREREQSVNNKFRKFYLQFLSTIFDQLSPLI